MDIIRDGCHVLCFVSSQVISDYLKEPNMQEEKKKAKKKKGTQHNCFFFKDLEFWNATSSTEQNPSTQMHRG